MFLLCETSSFKMSWSLPVVFLHYTLTFILVLLGFILSGLNFLFEKTYTFPQYRLYNNTGFFITLGLAISIVFMFTFGSIFTPSTSVKLRTNIGIIVRVSTLLLIISTLVAIFVSVEQQHVNRIIFKEQYSKDMASFLVDPQAAKRIQDFQLRMHCCGYNSSVDWKLLYKYDYHPSFSGKVFVPSSCCGIEVNFNYGMDVCKSENIVYKDGCHRLSYFDQYDPIYETIVITLACLVLLFIIQMALYFCTSNWSLSQ